MGGQWIGIVITAALSIAALFVSVRALRHSARSAEAAERSAHASERSADASEESSQAAERSAQADERSVALAEAEAKAAAARSPWQLTYNGGSQYLLTNEGAETAYRVEIKSADPAAFIRSQEPQDLGPGDVLDFIATFAMGVKDRRITVTWHREPESNGTEPQSWRSPLPG